MSAPKFQKNTELAWSLDVESGYRAAVDLSWKLRPVSELEKRGVFKRSTPLRIDRAVDLEEHKAPEISVEPIEGERLRVRSTVELVLQAPNDTGARRAVSIVEVNYGTVLRAGPILFALLLPSQADALRRGTLELPRLGGGMESESTWGSLAEADKMRAEAKASTQASRLRLALGSLVALALIVALSLYFLWPRTNPDALIIAFSSLDSPDAQLLAPPIVSSLEEIGFEPIVTLDERWNNATEMSRDELLRALSEERAPAALLITVEQTGERAGIVPNQRYFEFSVTAQLRGGGGRLERSASTSMGGEAPSRREALEEFAGHAIELLLHPVRSDLVTQEVERPTTKTRGGGRTGNTSIYDLADAARASQYTAKTYQESCRLAEQALDEVERGAKTRRLTEACAEHYPLGLSPDGGKLFVQVETIQPFFTFSRSSKVLGSQIPEALVEIDIATGKRRVLSKARHYFGLGAATVDGRWVIAIEQEGRLSALVSVNTESGARRVLHVIESPVRLSFPNPSPEGRYVAVWKRPTRGAERQLNLFDSTRGTLRPIQREATSAEWVQLAVTEGRAPQLLLALVLEGEPPQIALLDPESLEERGRVGDEENRVDAVIGAAEGILLFSLRGTCDLGRYAPITNETTRLELGRCLHRPVVSAGTKVIGILRASPEGDPMRGDTELAEVDLTTGESTIITANGHDERYLRAASASRRIAVGRVPRNNYEHIPRVATFIIDP